MAEIIERGVQSAIELEEKGQIREAYFTFLNSSQSAITSLQEIKFVRSSIVTSPRQYPILLDSLKTCLAHIESIIESNSSVIQKASPPPLPPKPSRIKPTVPPRPPPPPPPRQAELQDNSTSSSIYQQPLPINVSPPPRIPPPDSILQQLDHQDNSIVSIVPEGQVDPNYLVPAQTNAGDSLTVPSPNHHTTDHVPLIPTPPLLTTHRQLQQKLSDLEEKLQQCRAQQKDNSSPDEQLDQMISHYMQLIAEIRTTLNGVRTIYMSAATIPSVLQFQPVIMAYQVTLIEATIFNAIPPMALLEHSSRHPHPRIVASTDFFNYFTRCIEHSILLPQEASSRAQLVHYWIKVASCCLDVSNYQTLKAIVSALNTPPVQRLKRTWAYVPRKSASRLESLDELMSEANNYENYRETLGTENSLQLLEHYAKPTVPFLGTFIHDITYLLAAYKKSGYEHPQDEPRIQSVLSTMSRFQKGP
ncbi:ras GEF, partial [Backusella circina FSU 941]